MVNTITTVYTTSRIFSVPNFLGPCAAKNLEKTIVRNIIQQKQYKVYLQISKRSSGYKEKRGALSVFSLMLKPRG
jgi:hypothetical protein